VQRIGFILLAVLGLYGCAHKAAVPDDYWGPQAKVSDSYTMQGKTHADFFYLDSINGQKIEDSREASRSASHGRGSLLIGRTVERAVPARKATFRVVGRTQYAAPIDQFFHTIYEISGDVEFAPKPNHSYTVTGHIFDNGDDDSYMALWIVDDQTGELVSPKIELEGASSLNFFDKLIR